MNPFDATMFPSGEFAGAGCDCSEDLTGMLTVANVGQGMDPLQAALEAQLQEPLIKPFLF